MVRNRHMIVGQKKATQKCPFGKKGKNKAKPVVPIPIEFFSLAEIATFKTSAQLDTCSTTNSWSSVSSTTRCHTLGTNMGFGGGPCVLYLRGSVQWQIISATWHLPRSIFSSIGCIRPEVPPQTVILQGKGGKSDTVGICKHLT